jgi:hypothetical protein
MRKRSISLICAFLSTALLVACGAGNGLSLSTPTVGAPQVAAVKSAGAGSRNNLSVKDCTPQKSHCENFSYTGLPQTFVVPSDVTEITVEAWGAHGEGKMNSGAFVEATVPVIAQTSLAVFVGGDGGNGSNASAGGYNGGGNGANPGGGGAGGGGGGASDVDQNGYSLSDRIVVAGGAGGAGGGGVGGGGGGVGGGRAGGNGKAGGYSGGKGCNIYPGGGGEGGVQVIGGEGGAAGSNVQGNAPGAGGDGEEGTGGDGGLGGGSGFYGGSGGGGGGGWYGGGGGGGGGSDPNVCYGGGGGGGGGSSYVEPSATHVKIQKNSGPPVPSNGYVSIFWKPNVQ